MKITERKVSEAQLKEVARMILSPKSVINLDKRDVESVLVGKCGVLYEAQQEDEDKDTFINTFFEELSNKPQVIDCHYILISMGVPEDIELLMDDVDIIHEFMGKLKSDIVETKWGFHVKPEGDGMTLIALCTNEVE